MTRKTYRIKIRLEGWHKDKIFRTDGIPTHCCSFQADYFCWEKNTKYNHYEGWNGYISERHIKNCLAQYNPNGLVIA